MASIIHGEGPCSGDIKNPFLTPGQCRKCVSAETLGVLSKRDLEVIESRQLQLMSALRGRGLHSFPNPLNLSLLCPCPLNLS
jgi:hypothetical protein